MKEELASVAAYRDRIDRCLSLVRDRLTEDLRLEDLAEAACFSKFHFHRIFSAIVGETPADYIKRLRLERAANLVSTRASMNFTEIALSCGFSTPSAFSRDFSAAYGMSPKRYRLKASTSGTPGSAIGAGGWGTELGSGPGSIDVPGLSESLEASREIGPLGPFTFAQLMHAGGYGPGIGSAWGRLCGWAVSRGLMGGGGPGAEAGKGPLMAGIPWDNPDITQARKCRYSVCVEVPPGTPVSGAIGLLELPRRIYLSVRYHGPESAFSAAYRSLYRDILPSSGMIPADAPAVEFHLAFPTRSRDPIFDVRIAVPVDPLP